VDNIPYLGQMLKKTINNMIDAKFIRWKFNVYMYFLDDRWFW